ncbi:nucleoside triphosphate pyrophosphatase [Sphingosinicella sp. YJ22]|uniref:Maf family protein n=1 Tax=Sphingosinicella sp. YJ22 TaxID=1104780 RepID=UPI001407CA4F|nr:nucleoside triphosphate pyrophosphatase [Sphingosinicella sp. YJ22]
MSGARLILASASPRRLELLGRLGAVPDEVVHADIDESPRKAELPTVYAARMAAEKAVAVARPGDVLVAADTVVAAGRRILPKAETEAEARASLRLLSGRRHRVHSAVTVVDADGKARHRLSTSIVAFKPLSEDEIDAYLASGEWHRKAGGYAIQGRAEALVRMLQGSHSGVMGLPLFETRALLRAAGWPVG